jgi:hypothetical protein
LFSFNKPTLTLPVFIGRKYKFSEAICKEKKNRKTLTTNKTLRPNSFLQAGFGAVLFLILFNGFESKHS